MRRASGREGADSCGPRPGIWSRGGGLADRRLWADFGDCFQDGICINAEGCVWCPDVSDKQRHRKSIRRLAKLEQRFRG
jgi:hypothetical protein